MTFFDLLHAGKFLKSQNWSQRARRLYLRDILENPICLDCGADKLNYLLTMRRICAEEHGNK